MWPDRKRGCLGYRGYRGFFSPTFINPYFRYSNLVNVENLDFKNPRFSNICLKLGFQKSEISSIRVFIVNIENTDVLKSWISNICLENIENWDFKKNPRFSNIHVSIFTCSEYRKCGCLKISDFKHLSSDPSGEY